MKDCTPCKTAGCGTACLCGCHQGLSEYDKLEAIRTATRIYSKEAWLQLREDLDYALEVLEKKEALLTDLAIRSKEILRRFKIVTGGDEKAAFEANLIISKIEKD